MIKSVLPVLLFCILGILAIFAALNILLWLFFIVASLFISRSRDYSKPSKFYSWVMNLWYSYMCRFVFRIKLSVSGVDKVPSGQRFLFVSNHRSNVDNFIHCMVLKREPLAFISKTENFQRPVAGRYMRRNLYLELDRKSMKKSFAAIERAIGYIKAGLLSVGVFPEGTRSKNGELLEFKPGCFRIAEKARCPVVVGVTQGTELVKNNFPWHRTCVSFDIIRVITPQELEGRKTVEISDMVHDLISSYLK